MQQMMIVTIQAATVKELREKIRELAKGFGVDYPDTQMALPLAKIEPAVAAEWLKKQVKEVEPLAIDADEEEEKPAKKKPGRPKKEAAKVDEPVAVEVEEEAPAEEEEAAPPTSATREDAMAALQNVNSKKGLPAAKEILSKFSAQRFSELKDTDFPKFVQACQKACA